MRVSKTLLGVVLACALAACGTAPAPQIVYRNQPILPPADLLKDCQHAAKPAGDTVADMEVMLIDERGVLETCDWGDKAALREWEAKNSPASAPVADSATKAK